MMATSCKPVIRLMYIREAVMEMKTHDAKEVIFDIDDDSLNLQGHLDTIRVDALWSHLGAVALWLFSFLSPRP